MSNNVEKYLELWNGNIHIRVAIRINENSKILKAICRIIGNLPLIYVQSVSLMAFQLLLDNRGGLDKVFLLFSSLIMLVLALDKSNSITNSCQ